MVFFSGAIGGYATGGFWGGVIGSVVGAGVGAIMPWGSSTAGAFVGGMLSSAAGQVAGNLREGKPTFSLDPALVLASGLGGSTAAFATRAAAAAGLTGAGVETGLSVASDLLFTVPADKLSPGPYNFGGKCE